MVLYTCGMSIETGHTSGRSNAHLASAGSGIAALLCVLVLLFTGCSSGSSSVARQEDESTTTSPSSTTSADDDADTTQGTDDADDGDIEDDAATDDQDRDGDGTTKGDRGDGSSRGSRTGDEEHGSRDGSGKRSRRGSGSNDGSGHRNGTAGNTSGSGTTAPQTTTRPSTSTAPATTTRPTTPTTTTRPSTTTTTPRATTTTTPRPTTTTTPATTSTTSTSTTSTSTTSTSTTSTTSTSTSTTSTTTSTSAPDREPPGPDPTGRDNAGWRFEPSSVLLAPGETAVVELVHADADGVDDGGLPPADPTLTFSDPGAATVEALGSGRFRVTAGDDVGFTAVGATVPHAPLAVPLLVTIAELQPGVKTFADSELVWPRADQDEAAPAQDPTKPYQSTTGVGPFTWAQMQTLALTKVVNGLDEEVDEHPFVLVLEDSDLAVGDLVTSTGDAQVLGEVISVQTETVGAHTLSLVTVQLRSPGDLFSRMNLSYSTQDLIAVGAAAVPDAPGDMGPWNPMQLASGSGGGTGSGPGGRSLMANVRALFAAAADDDDAPVEDPEVGYCKAMSGSISLVTVATSSSVKLGDDKSMLPTLKAIVNINDSATMMELRAGYSGSLKLGLDAKATLSGAAEVKCGIADLPRIRVVAPPPVGPFLTLEGQPRLFATFGLTGSGGPVLGYKVECTSTANLSFGFRINSLGGDPFTNLSSVNVTGNCEKTPSMSDGIGGPSGVSVEGAVTMGLAVETPLNIRVGGPTIEKIAALFDNPDIGLITLVSGSAGLTGKLAWANTSSVLDAKATPAVVEIAAGLSFGFQDSTIKWFVGKIAKRLSVTLDLPKLTMEEPIAQAFRGISKGTTDPTVTVDGTAVTGPVKTGDRIDIEAITKASTGRARTGLSADFNMSKLTAYVLKDGNYTKFGDLTIDKLTQPTDSETGPTVKAHFTLTEDQCTLIEGQTDHELALVSVSNMLTLDTPGFVGTVKVRCGDPKLRWEPDTLTYGPKISGQRVTKTSDLQFLDPASQSATHRYVVTGQPAWVTVEGADGTMDMHAGTATVDGKSHDAMVATVKVTVDCDVLGKEKATATLTARISEPTSANDATATLTVDADCRELWTTLDPDELEERGGTAVIRYSAGQKGVAWSIGGGGATYTPSSGTFDSDQGGEVSVQVEFENLEPRCEGINPAHVETGTLTSDNAEDETIRLNYKEKRGGPCPTTTTKPPCTANCNTADGSGDPHMRSFDGQSFDLQVDGEYRYQVPDPDVEGADAPTLHVQHSYYGTPGSHAKTILAMAVDYHGHRIEAYRNPIGKILIDGEEVTWNDPLARTLEPDLSLTVAKGKLSIFAGGYTYDADGLTSYMNVKVKAPTGSPIRGILGSPNGDPDDDLRAADGHVITLAQARAHSYDFFGFTESWRVTDPAESLFSIPLDTFDTPVAPFDPAVLAPYVAQVQDAFAELSPVCAGLGDAGPTSYAVVSIALEVYSGTPLDEAMAFTCTYQVYATTTNPNETVQVNKYLSGFDIHMSAPGLTSCDTVIPVNGVVSCDLTPDHNALVAGGIPDGPPTVTMVVTHPVTGDVVATGTKTFAAKASFGSSVSVNAVAAGTDPVDGSVTISGTLTRAGEPITSSTLFVVEEYDADGKLLWYANKSVTPAADGSYAMTRIANPLAAELRVTVRLGVAGDTYTRTIPLDQPNSQVVDFDVDHKPPVVTLGGRWEGVPATRVQLVGKAADGRVTVSTSLTVVVDGGQWSTTVELPKDTTTLTATALVSAFSADNPSVTVTDLEPGTRSIPFDVVFDPVMVHVTGHLTIDGAPPSGSIPYLAQGKDADGNLVAAVTRYVTVDPLTGAISGNVELPQGSKTAEVTLKPMATSWSWRSATTTVAPGDNTVTIDADLVRQQVQLSGHLTVNGAPATGAIPLSLTMLDINGATTGTSNVTVTPDASGAVSLPTALVLPFGTTDVRVTAQILAGSAGSATQIVSVADGVTTAAFAIDLHVRVVTIDGTYTSADGPYSTWFQLYWNHQDGSQDVTTTGMIDPDASGKATSVFIRPADVTGVTLYQSGPGGESWIMGDVDFGPDPEVTITWDGRPREVQLTGEVRIDGAPAASVTRNAAIQAIDEEGNPKGSSASYRKTFTLTTDASGAFDTVIRLPEPPGTTSTPPASWQLQVTNGNGFIQTYDLGTPPRGVTGQSIVIDENAELPLTLRTGWYPNADMKVVAYSWVPGSLTFSETGGAWTQTVIPMSSMSLEYEPLTYTWKMTMGVPAAVTYIELHEGNGYEYSRTIKLPNPGAANTIDLTEIATGNELLMSWVDSGSGFMTMTGDGGSATAGNYCPGFPSLIVTQVEVIAHGNTDGEDWQRNLGTYPIFPDRTTGRYRVTLPVPFWEDAIDNGYAPGFPTSYELLYSADPAYSVWSVAAFGSETLVATEYGVPGNEYGVGMTREFTPNFGCAM